MDKQVSYSQKRPRKIARSLHSWRALRRLIRFDDGRLLDGAFA